MLSRPRPDSVFSIGLLETGPDRGKQLLAPGPRNAATCVTHAYVMSIARLIAIPRFHVDRVREVGPDLGPSRLRVEFTIPTDTRGKTSGSHISSGWLVISPGERWILHGYGLVETLNARQSVQATRVGSVDYVRDPKGETRPARYGCRLYRGRFEADPTDPSLVPITTEDFQFTSFLFGDTPAREFTLAGFGLPEFGEPASRRLNRPYPWWIIGAAVGALGLAVTLRRLAKRPLAPTSDPVA